MGVPQITRFEFNIINQTVNNERRARGHSHSDRVGNVLATRRAISPKKSFCLTSINIDVDVTTLVLEFMRWSSLLVPRALRSSVSRISVAEGVVKPSDASEGVL